jgi:hypothetical protein
MNAAASTSLAGLSMALAALDCHDPPARQLDCLIVAGYDQLPLPASGQTLARWQALAAVAAHDLSLAKLYEGHTDALAILAELDVTVPALEFVQGAGEQPSSWGVWAAEPPSNRVRFEEAGAGPLGPVSLTGTKAWCSGAESGSHALLTAWAAGADEPQLIAVELAQRNVVVTADHWNAVGMRGSASLAVTFNGALGWPIGLSGAYLSRPGFWHGGAGVAACWYGGARRIAQALHQALVAPPPARRDAFRLAAAGRVDVALQGVAQQLRRAALWIDTHPLDDAREVALRVRLATAQCAALVLAQVGDALGPAPFCVDAGFAQAAADLPVFIRQSHADHDYAALGGCVANRETDPWPL